jgi:hypothetical protein
MNAEVFAIAISNLLFGFTLGLAIETLSHKFRVDVMNEAMQKTIGIVFEKDKHIDNLSSELEIVKAQRNQLYSAIETSRRAFESVRNISPPCSPLMRCNNCVNECEMRPMPR